MKHAHTTKGRPFALQFPHSLVALALMSACAVPALAQDAHTLTPQSNSELTSAQRHRANALLRIVRESTERFQNVAEAEAEGYALQFGCVSGENSGAMGLH